MISSLQRFDKLTAAGILARAALAIYDESNPAGDARLPGEASLRAQVMAEARSVLQLDPNDSSPQALERLSDVLDAECDGLVGPTDTESALNRLAEKGQLPSDLFKINVIENVRVLYGKKYAREEKLIEDTVRAPDQEQHYGPPKDPNEPFLISLFLKHYPSEYPLRSFNLLVAGQRSDLTLNIHQVWRIYPADVDVTGAETLVDVLRRFSDKFGEEISLGGKKGHFIYAADIPRGEKIEGAWNVSDNVAAAKKGKAHRITMSFFTQANPQGTSNQVALAIGIDVTRYLDAISARGW